MKDVLRRGILGAGLSLLGAIGLAKIPTPPSISASAVDKEFKTETPQAVMSSLPLDTTLIYCNPLMFASIGISSELIAERGRPVRIKISLSGYTKNMKGTVTQEWISSVGWKMQSILFSGLRGPDQSLCPKVKEVTRWMRRTTQNDADASQSYMSPSSLPRVEELEKELEYLSCHFVHHFADALRIIALYHPDNQTKQYAKDIHYYIADELFHFVPESDEIFVKRHEDKV